MKDVPDLLVSNWRLEGSVGWIVREKRKKVGGIRKEKGAQVCLLAHCNEGGWKERQSSEGGIMKGKNDGCAKVSHGGCRTNLEITSKLLLQPQQSSHGQHAPWAAG